MYVLYHHISHSVAGFVNIMYGDSGLLRRGAVSLGELYATFRRKAGSACIFKAHAVQKERVKLKALGSFATQGTAHPTQCHIPEDINPLNRFKNLKYRIKRILYFHKRRRFFA
jgi:hypothetical protein